MGNTVAKHPLAIERGVALLCGWGCGVRACGAVEEEICFLNPSPSCSCSAFQWHEATGRCGAPLLRFGACTRLLACLLTGSPCCGLPPSAAATRAARCCWLGQLPPVVGGQLVEEAMAATCDLLCHPGHAQELLGSLLGKNLPSCFFDQWLGLHRRTTCWRPSQVVSLRVAASQEVHVRVGASQELWLRVAASRQVDRCCFQACLQEVLHRVHQLVGTRSLCAFPLQQTLPRCGGRGVAVVCPGGKRANLVANNM